MKNAKKYEEIKVMTYAEFLIHREVMSLVEELIDDIKIMGTTDDFNELYAERCIAEERFKHLVSLAGKRIKIRRKI